MERIKLNLGVMLAGMQSVGVGHPVDAEEHRLAVYNE
jgi:hypothetical protein